MDFSERLSLFPTHRNEACRYGVTPTPKDWFEYLAHRDYETRGKIDQKEFTYISYSREAFAQLMCKHIEDDTQSFIDVGCGGGDKLDLVKKLFPHLRVEGVEHDPAMAIWAGLYADKVYCCDATTLDYRPYDLIYAYWPISNRDGMDKLIERIVDTMSAKAKFILLGTQHQKVNSTYNKRIIHR